MADDRELDDREFAEGLARFDADIRRGMIRGPMSELLPWSIPMTTPYGTAASAEAPLVLAQAVSTSPAAPRQVPAPGRRERDRNVWIQRGGTIQNVGWEDPNNHKLGYGYRVYVVLPDGSRDVYGHLDPESIRWRIGDQVRQGFHLGRYGTSGNATDPSIHYGQQDPQGRWIDPGTGQLPVVDGQVTSGFGTRTHPRLRTPMMHNGIDVVGPERWRSDDDLF